MPLIISGKRLAAGAATGLVAALLAVLPGPAVAATTVTATQDSYTDASQPTTNFGSKPYIRVDGTNSEARAVFERMAHETSALVMGWTWEELLQPATFPADAPRPWHGASRAYLVARSVARGRGRSSFGAGAAPVMRWVRLRLVPWRDLVWRAPGCSGAEGEKRRGLGRSWRR